MNEKDNCLTVVIFRKLRDGDVVAVFPEIVANYDPYLCADYMHVGQHSSCNPSYLVSVTKPATPAEYDALKRELEEIGYELIIRKRLSPSYLETRRRVVEFIKESR